MLDREATEQTAALWVAREDRGLVADEVQALSVWLNAETGNRVAYLRMKTGWQRTGRLAALKDPADVDHAPRHREAIAAAIILALLAGAAGLYLHNRMRGSETYVAHIGERPIVRLADGTRIQLNTNSQVQARVTKAERMVTLDRGEAYFDVIHDAKRPFVVYAGNRRITDLGTKFSVRREGDDVRVVVTEGRVRVDRLGAPLPAAPVFAGRDTVVVSKADEILVAAKGQREIDDDLSWRAGMLTFDQATLADAAQQFNRYNSRKLVVEGAARDIKIGGSFRADNIEVFAQLVKNALGLKVTQTQQQITISQ
jgi:transmembrane sensor